MKQSSILGFTSLSSTLAHATPDRTSRVRVHVPSPAFDPDSAPPASLLPASSVVGAIDRSSGPLDIIADASVAFAAARMFTQGIDPRTLERVLNLHELGIRRIEDLNRDAAPSVQVLVRGHRKRQVCGKGRADRRWIHVEPYWRGPEDAPIALRSHKLTREE